VLPEFLDMKKQITILTLSLALMIPLLASAHDEPPRSMQEKQKAAHKRVQMRQAGVRQIIGLNYHYTKNERAATGLRQFQMVYDTNGCMTELTIYRDDTLDSKSINYYNPSLQCITTIDFSNGKTYSGVDRYEYNDYGFIKEISGWSVNSKLLETCTYEYPEAPVVMMTKTDSLGKPVYTLAYKYNKTVTDLSSLCIEAIRRDAKGKQELRVVNHYDAVGNRIKKEIYNAGDTLSYYFTYTCLPDGEPSVITRFTNKDKKEWSDTYLYDDKGLIKSVTSRNERGEITNVLEYEYYYNKK
jgi:hypothetical protein